MTDRTRLGSFDRLPSRDEWGEPNRFGRDSWRATSQEHARAVSWGDEMLWGHERDHPELEPDHGEENG